MKFRKIWPLIGAICVSLVSAASADSYHDGSGSFSNSMQQQSSTQSGYQRATYREITPNAGPRVAHGADVFITADFIWWKAVQDGMEYAFTGVDIFSATSQANPFVNVPKGKAKSVGQDWAPGFKVGLGLNLNHDGWDLYAQYTWLHASNASSISRSSNGNPQVFGQSLGYGSFASSDPFFNVLGEEARSRWGLHFNVIDLELGRNFYLSQFLTMRPFIGLKGTWQDQDWKTKFSSSKFQIDLPGTDLDVTGPYRMKRNLDVWGIGVRGGFNIAWYMSKSWSIYGDLAWTSMWANYSDNKRRDQMDDANTGNSKTELHIENDAYYTIKYVGEMELGLRWETWFYDDNYHFAIQAGWEQQVWIQWTQFLEIFNQAGHDLNFHGLNLKFRFDF